MRVPLLSVLCLAVAFLGGCAQYASVTQIRPTFRPIQTTVSAFAMTQKRIQSALDIQRKNPREALSEYLAVAQAASREIARNPKDESSIVVYNFAVARIFSIVNDDDLEPWAQPVAIPGVDGGFQLEFRKDPRKGWNPGLFNIVPADEFDVNGTYVKEHSLRKGLGAPMVAIGKQINENARTDFTIPRIYYGVTAMVRFEGKRAILAVEDPLASETVLFAGRSMPMAANFTVPLAVMLAQTDPKKLELSRLLNPAKYAETARIARMQPYDPNKTVVMVVHGLMDTPATWTPMINALRSDETIRRNYQFWFYSYPSGYPYPYSASILRRELDDIKKRFPLHKKMVVIGHSMGGCISRLLITDTGDTLWKELFKTAPADTDLSENSRKLLSDSLIFDHRSEIGRVIFISAPLRGSDLASNWMGRLGSMLVKAPATMLSVGKDALKVASFQGDDLKLKRIPNSVDTLAPNNRFVKAIQTIPVTPGIPYHVISGDRGKGGNKDHTKPVMSDGIVPYWSSHMDGAQSELVVPSHHSAHQNPEAIAEVARILKQALRR